MSTSSIALFAGLIILAGLAAFQLGLVAGAPFGHFAWGGGHRILPKRLRWGSLVAVGFYGGFALVLADRAGAIAVLPEGVSPIAAWIVAAYGWLGTGLNAISRSRSERMVMTPVAAVLALASTLIALG